jgi:hypothetical protein
LSGRTGTASKPPGTSPLPAQAPLAITTVDARQRPCAVTTPPTRPPAMSSERTGSCSQTIAPRAAAARRSAGMSRRGST